jgi:hypothetical protein
MIARAKMAGKLKIKNNASNILKFWMKSGK